MPDTRIDKILVGSPKSMKVVKGQLTQVKKIVVGVPINNIATTGDTINNIFNSFLDSEVDGKIYPLESDRSKILIRRSQTAGAPTSLFAGELAYSMLTDIGIDGTGNGGDRLYIGVGADSGIAPSIVTIGGKYFTDLLDHQQGILTAQSAIITDSTSAVNQLIVDDITLDGFTITGTAGNLTLAGETTLNDRLKLLTVDSGGTKDVLVLQTDGTVALRRVEDLLLDENTDQDTLQTVTARGDSTDRSITTAGLTTGNIQASGLTALDETTIAKSLTIDSDLTVSGTTTFSTSGLKILDTNGDDLNFRSIGDNNFIIDLNAGVGVTGQLRFTDLDLDAFRDLNVRGITTLDSTTAENLDVQQNLDVAGITTLDSTDVTELTINGVALSEFIDDDVAQLMLAGRGIIITYDDVNNNLKVESQLAGADSDNAGIAFFNDSDFTVVNGQVTLSDTIGGGGF